MIPNFAYVCDWFARCDRQADGIVAHPVLEYVPTCAPCAAKLDLDLITWDRVEISSE